MSVVQYNRYKAKLKQYEVPCLQCCVVLDLPSDLFTGQGQAALRYLQHLQMSRTSEDTGLVLHDHYAKLVSSILHAGNTSVCANDRTPEELPIVEDGRRLSQTVR